MIKQCISHRQITSVGVVLACLAVFVCNILSGQAHACCKQPETTMPHCAGMETPEPQKQDMLSACLCELSEQAAPSAQTDGLPPGLKHTALSAVLPTWTSILAITPPRRTAMALAYVPDQSRRYLELRVLLN